MASPVPKPPLEIKNLDPDAESYLQRGWSKCKQQPLVPIGVIATCAALGAAFRELKRGNSTRLNKFLRLRVVAQGATIAACVVGSFIYSGPIKEAKEAEKRQEREKMMDILASVGDGKSAASVSSATPSTQVQPPAESPQKIESME
ncbi:Respiratory supercomplex factor 1, mitochondrial [Tulasnella sp. 419]|nr:Respiratory supercomplex factor 1, mitochondrial [Tulasnella sp. 419]